MSRVVPALRALAVFLAVITAGGASRAADDAADVARLLAGMQPAADSPLAKFAEGSGWRRHAKSLDAAWASLDAQRLAKIRAWSEKQLASPQPVLFYMFSGPDYLYADAFFPKADTYVLSGLEPVGAVPDVTKFSRGALSAELGGMRAALTTVLNYSFFITAKMKRQLRVGKIKGTLPILYVFLARSGKTVEEVSFIALDEEGAVHAADEAGLKTPTKGVKIVFSGSDGKKHTLYYFSTDLSNGGIKRHEGFMKFCAKLGKGDAFIKSASYLLHSGSFSKVRDFLLENAALLLQDDSGVPLTYLKAAAWDLRPFGRYLGPIAVFPGRYQSKMARLFRKAPAIDFGVGYRWRPRQSNLLLAVKKAAAAEHTQQPEQPTASTKPQTAEQK